MSQNDDDLHDARISALYRQLDDVEPQTDTDALIRAAARRAVQAGPRSSRLTFATKRFLATAAMLLLGVGLVLRLQLREPQEFADALAVRTTPDVTAPREAAAPRERVEMTAPQALTEKAAAPAEDSAIATEPRARAAAPAQRDAARDATAGSKVNSLAEGAPHVAVPASVAGAAASPPAVASSVESARGASAPQEIAGLEAAGGAGPGQPAPAAPAANAAERQLALRSEAAAAESARSYAPAREKKAEVAADQAPGPAPDYRQLMAGARYAEALQQLTATGPARSAVDRDLLGLLLGRHSAPACGQLSAEVLAEEKLLCHFLQVHARGESLPADWQQQLDRQGLTSGAKLYRRRAAEMLFGP